MKCEEMMNRFLDIDRESPLPRDLAEHFAECPRCAGEAKKLSALFTNLRGIGEEQPDYDMAASIMMRITASVNTLPESQSAAEEISLSNWIGTGFFILFGIFLVPFSSILPGLYHFSGRGFEVALHIVLGSLITVYATMFIASHTVQLRRLLRPGQGLRK